MEKESGKRKRKREMARDKDEKIRDRSIKGSKQEWLERLKETNSEKNR